MDQHILTLFILVTGYIFGLTLMILNRNSPSTSWKKLIKAKLEKLDATHKSRDIDVLKFTLIEADKLLGYTLEKYGIKGNTVGERLKNAKIVIVGKDIPKGKRVSETQWATHKRKLDLYNKIWEAHKLRNEIVHTMSFNPTIRELKTGYTSIKRGIKTFL